VKKASLNLIDKAIAFVNPQGAVDRLVARQRIKNFEYDAVKYSRQRKGPSQLSGAEDYRSNYDRVELMKRARDLAENVGLVRSILMKFASHTAANISYQARTENPEVNTDVEMYWAEWFDKCDITTRHTGSTMMQVAIMSMLRDGDFLFCLVRDSDGNLKIQGIEGDRLGDPFKVYTSSELIGGIHIDQRTGSPTAYDIYSRSIGDMYTYQVTIPASQAFHLFDPLRIDQYRGISAFHTAINDATDIHEIVGFEKMSAKVASSQSAIIKRNNNNASDLSSLTNDQDINGSPIKLEAIESGKISYLEPGEDIVFPDGPSRPSGAFAEFHKILLRNICLGVGIPYSFAVDPSAMSGPTARLEMQQAGRTFRRYQKLLDDKVLRPIKNIVIADGVARGLIEKNVGSRTTRGIFNFGANVSIDLGRESASAISEFKTGLRTAADIYAERGQDFESSMRQRAIEAKLIKDLSEKYGVDPETISDIVPPKPTQTKPEAPSVNPVIPAKDSPESDEDIGGDQKPIPEDPVDGDGQEVGLDCGTGAGGFKEGNTCSGGGGAGGQDSEPKERYRDRIEGTDEEVRNEERKRERKLKNLKQKVVESKQREADIRKQISDLNQKIASKTTDYDAKIAAIDKVAEEMIQESKQRQVKIQQDLDKKLAAIAEKSKKRQEAIVEKYKKRKEEREAKRSVVSTKRSSSLEKNLEEGNEIESDEKIESEISNAEKNNDKLNSLVSELKEILEEIGNEEAKKKVLESLDPASIKMLIQGMMGGIELGKYDGIDFTPPQGARDAAKRALDVRETKPSSQRGMTPVGIARARDLQNGVKLSPDTVRRMLNFLTRHEVDKKGATWDEQGKGWQAWNGWGGDAGYAWARKVVGQMEARDKKELAEPSSCPIATQDIKTNLANRQTAVDDANYGPANPNEPNEDYWKAKADEFQGDVATAKKMLCGNCAAFDQRSKVLGCIKKGIGEDANEVAIGGDLGYCEIFDFKCAAKRTCDAWIVGGAITDKKEELARPVSQTPAPPKERIKGSKENPEGTASTRSKAGNIEISAENEEALKNKIAEFKDKHPSRKAPTIGALKKVFRRGAGAFSTSFRPTISGGKPNSRNAWAMARVNKFLKMAGGGEVKDSYRKADGDLL
jgi:lambda family phage portal protein